MKDREGSLCRTCALKASAFRVKITLGGSLLGVRRSSATGGARRAAASTSWRDPNGVSVIQHSADPSDAKVFRAHAPPQGVCENHVCAHKLSAKQQTGGDSFVDNHEAVKIGDLEKNSKVIKVIGANLDREMSPDAKRSGKEWTK